MPVKKSMAYAIGVDFKYYRHEDNIGLRICVKKIYVRRRKMKDIFPYIRKKLLEFLMGMKLLLQLISQDNVVIPFRKSMEKSTLRHSGTRVTYMTKM